MAATQSEKAAAFEALHRGPGAFVIPNPWDAGSASILAGMGFKALATSSGAAAGVLGLRDGKINRDEAMAHARAIVAATHLPVSADLEKGFGDAPSVVAETIRLAAETGLVGGSIEDATGNPEKPLYDLGMAVERIAAAVEAARALPFKFTLTARAETTCAAIRIWTTRSGDCRRSRKQARMFCSRPGYPISPQCVRCVPRYRSPSISWPAFRHARSL